MISISSVAALVAQKSPTPLSNMQGVLHSSVLGNVVRDSFPGPVEPAASSSSAFIAVEKTL